ncbi:glycosyltransferase family 2 protein [Butyrivibrio fibrisolvens]|uniref:glycosyltransferase family 2 protein n=1 Tax=Butyrivibrio fibrisolvens TaxID=831 RepID=UPI00041ACEA5|nr:glycosyltransferase family 2 protein [Butyrivibrio fibrisolvens]
MKKLISYVIPCYRSENTLSGVIDELNEAMKKMTDEYDYEIICVNDGSPDETWKVIRRLCSLNKNMTGINFAKNFGQHAALMAGLNKTKGDIVVCLDDDGQTPACEVDKLIKAIEQGADAAYARYEHKKHSAFRNFGSAMNEWMLHIMLNKPNELFVSSYFAVRRFVVNEMCKYKGSYPYVIGLVLRTTNNIVNVDINHRARTEGTSGYNLIKLLRLWMNGFTAFSIQPLRIATFSGSAFAVLGFVYGIYTIIKKLVLGDQLDVLPLGFSALMSVMVFMGGILMLMVGMAGEYIGRSYISLNNDPQFVIRDIEGAGSTENVTDKKSESYESDAGTDI